MSQVAPSRVLLLGTETSDGVIMGVTTGTSKAVERTNDGVLSFYVRGIGAVGAGTIIIEEADFGQFEQDYTGTWSTIATITVAAAAQTAYHVTDSSYGMIRARVGTTVTVGTATVAMRSRGAM